MTTRKKNAARTMRKATLVVSIRRFVRPVVVDEPWCMEEALVQLGEDLVGYGLAILSTIPGSHLEPESIPMGLLVPPPPRGGVVFEHGIPLRTACRCSVRVRRGDPLHDEASEAVNRWVARNRARWGLEDGSDGACWREVAFLTGYHAATHAERRVKLARERDRRARDAMETHRREVDRMFDALDAGGR